MGWKRQCRHADRNWLNVRAFDGDYNEILAWLEQGSLEPEKVYVTHGEMVASDVMRKRIREKFGWDVEVPELFEEVQI